LAYSPSPRGHIDEVKVSTVLPEVIRIMSILPFQAGRLNPSL
jgi:hypothetical protein